MKGDWAGGQLPGTQDSGGAANRMARHCYFSPTREGRNWASDRRFCGLNGKPSKKCTSFEQPLAAHQRWHIDMPYINISGTFDYFVQHSGRL